MARMPIFKRFFNDGAVMFFMLASLVASFGEVSGINIVPEFIGSIQCFVPAHRKPLYQGLYKIND